MVVLYCEGNGRCPFIAWFHRLPEEAKRKCVNRMRMLRAVGHELRRPAADYLRKDIYELRFRVGRVQYRALYFFHGRTAVIVDGLEKTGREVPDIAIQRTLNRKGEFESAPAERTTRHEEWPEDM